MVKLTKIYTRGGDKGQTSLANGERLPKHDLRIEAYGTVDEANAAIGLVRLHTSGMEDDMLGRIQNDLFDAGADLALPFAEDYQWEPLRITAGQVERLEQEIDLMNAEIPPLDSFVLPGGSPASAFLHQARTVTRRAERLAARLAETEQVNAEVIRYLNRLSDHLFVLSRRLNNNGAGDVKWVPGANRE
ncbi:cob(I)yrinic acid a,c-diamide adenosyltransferase [Emcibacter nanhaiensis]|uniref:Corrinoid adenosyltransferase n=1 Tax=Emcibacter nanhaiensis TaxID=1505037 RepID=A0A501PN84_9PROT|nr:cob(I)yrinic acid a,c-diamide adenosyltransferase [Emcibacter nanhaiensis]TPD61755.1 cob(I)yrinic acid a,c-diamide adenosyltransferase [Emcibacter nanhaiensis]